MRPDEPTPDQGPLNPNVMWIVIGVLAMGLLALKLWPGNAPLAEPVAMLRTFVEGSYQSVRVREQDCRAAKDRLWVQVPGDGTGPGAVECIAYVASQPDPTGDTALIFLNGDVPSDELGQQHSAEVRQAIAANADTAARRFGLPVVIVGRPGLMGSTGFHQLGGLAEDAELINGAIDALKARFRLRRIALAGQSGGSRLIAQMLILGRDDVICAAMGSGAYGLPRLSGGGTIGTNIWGQPGHHFLVPLLEIDRLRDTGTLRTFVIGDPADTRALFTEQRAWADSLIAHHHHAVLMETSGAGPEHHGAAAMAIAAAAACVEGQSDSAIAALVKR